jgi:hypothetical protein
MLSNHAIPIRNLALVAALVAVSVSSGVAADRVGLGGDDLANPRIVPQILFGTSGFEPGVAAEWRFTADRMALVRPEVFINEDGRIGGGVSLGYELGFHLPDGHSLSIGPRIVFHNSDDSGWEGDAMVIYHMNVRPDGQATRHYIDVIGAVGVLEDKSKDDDNSEARGGASIGLAYGFQF